MGLLNRGEKKRKEEEKKHYQQESAIAEQSRPQGPDSQDAYNSLGRSVYMVMDPEVGAILDPRDTNGKPKPSLLRSLIPAFSHLNRVTKIGKLQAELLDLDYEALILITKMNMTEDEYESEGWRTLEALRIFAQSIVSDSFGGFKADIVTTQLKTIRTELAQEKKRRGPF